jgi:hypothetical protein
MAGAFLLVSVLGAVAGLVAAFIAGGLTMPKTVTKDNRSVWDPGFIGTVIAGAASAALLFALYGPLKDGVVVEVDSSEEAAAAGESDDTETVNVTIYDIVAAAMSGLAGSRILTSEVEKKYLRAATDAALSSDPDNPDNSGKASTAANARPVDVFKAM